MAFNSKTLREVIMSLSPKSTNKGEIDREIRVTLEDVKGSKYINVRIFEDYKLDGTLLPTKHGLYMSDEDAYDMFKAFCKLVTKDEVEMVLSELDEEGWEVEKKNKSKQYSNRESNNQTNTPADADVDTDGRTSDNVDKSSDTVDRSSDTSLDWKDKANGTNDIEIPDDTLDNIEFSSDSDVVLSGNGNSLNEEIDGEEEDLQDMLESMNSFAKGQ